MRERVRQRLLCFFVCAGGDGRGRGAMFATIYTWASQVAQKH